MNAANKLIAITLLSAVAVIAYAVVASAQTAAASSQAYTGDLSGSYKCSGYDPYDKTNYTENLVLKKTGDTYSVQLIHSDSVVPYNLGTGITMKGTNNVISYTYWDPQKPNVMGTELFEIKSDGSLQGAWTSSGTNWVGTENCTKA